MRNYKITLIIQAKDLDDANDYAEGLADYGEAIISNVEPLGYMGTEQTITTRRTDS